MRFARVIGTVWATRKDPTIEGIPLRVIQPMDESGRDSGEPLIAADRVSVREGDRVFFVGAREAAKAFPGKFAPLDATIMAIVDGAQLDDGTPAAPEDA